MREFDYSRLAERTWDDEILSYVAKIYEHRGRQELFVRRKPVEIKRLIEIAKVQSTEASNSIEGIVTTRARLEKLVNDKTTPYNRDEREILGYRNVLNLIHESYEYIGIRKKHILQLHGELLKYTELSYRGKFKTTANEITATLPSGERRVLFRPLEPYETSMAIERVCESYESVLAKELVNPLILIPCFILDFLCIHPFNDGNGRMSRLLTLLLLYRSGFMVGKYISIEKAIADTKEDYYHVLQTSDADWHNGANDPKPFIKYMLGIILNCYHEFEKRITVAEKAGVKSISLDIVREYVSNRIGLFTKTEVLQGCPSLGSSSVELTLKKLVEMGVLERIGKGRKTTYHYAAGE